VTSAAARDAASSRERIVGVDAARALAIFGMLAVHLGPTDAGGVLGRVYASPHGRASVLFVLVAGVGVSLLAASPSTSAGRTRGRLAWRAALLLPLGLALQELDHGASVILQDYALLFLVAMLVLRVPDRWLLALAGASTLLGPVAFWWGRANAPQTFDRSATHLTDPAGEVLHGLVLSGPYPLITWLAPFAFGLWLGRRDLRARHVRARLMLVGGALALAAAVTARGLVALLGRPTGFDDVRHLLTDAPHGQMPLWLLGSSGAAALVLGMSLVLADRARRLTWPLAATGQLALTMYVGHLLVLHAAPEQVTSDRLGEAALLLGAFTLVMVVAATAWRATFDRGPLELLLSRPPPLPGLGRKPSAASRLPGAPPTDEGDPLRRTPR
jgi:uncharacterized membrane protein YeiB